MKRVGRFAVIAFTLGLAQGVPPQNVQHAQAGECDHAPGSNCRCTPSNHGLLDALDEVADRMVKDSSKHTSVLSLLSRRNSSGYGVIPACDGSAHAAKTPNCGCKSCCDAKPLQPGRQSVSSQGMSSEGMPGKLRQVPVHQVPDRAMPVQPQGLPTNISPTPSQDSPGAIPTPVPTDATTDPFLDDSARLLRYPTNAHAVASATQPSQAEHYSFYRQINPQTGAVPARRRISSFEDGFGQGSDSIVLTEFSSRRTALSPSVSGVTPAAAAVVAPPAGISSVVRSSATEPPRLPTAYGPAARPIITIDPAEISSRNPLRKR